MTRDDLSTRCVYDEDEVEEVMSDYEERIDELEQEVGYEQERASDYEYRNDCLESDIEELREELGALKEKHEW